VALRAAVADFAPQVVHSHHPFLLGDTALRIAAEQGVPVVFTHHTLYDQYTHYLPGDPSRWRRFAAELSAGYCNLCDAVIAPSQSIAALLRRRNVSVPLEVIPTGIDVDRFAGGDGAMFRAAHDIPAGAFVVGHVGRLAPEKNLSWLGEAVAEFLRRIPGARFLVAGQGPAEADLRRHLVQDDLDQRLHLVGVLAPAELAGAYRAMDAFAFASQSETQGMVLVEALAAGVPVVAVDAPGVRDVVRDGFNGRLLTAECAAEFAIALSQIAALSPADRVALRRRAARSAQPFAMTRTADHALALYARLIHSEGAPAAARGIPGAIVRRIEEEWKIASNLAHAASDALLHPHGH
jgi:glycosyltransferase involved in cell wall biosynthesis